MLNSPARKKVCKFLNSFNLMAFEVGIGLAVVAMLVVRRQRLCLLSKPISIHKVFFYPV